MLHYTPLSQPHSLLSAWPTKQRGQRSSVATEPVVLSTELGLLFTDPSMLSTKPGVLSTKPDALCNKPDVLSTDPSILSTKPMGYRLGQRLTHTCSQTCMLSRGEGEGGGIAVADLRGCRVAFSLYKS